LSEVSTIETVFRACHLCEAHCGVAIEVDRERSRILSVRGDDEDPFSLGYLCPKAVGLQGVHEDPDRLRAPLRRTGNAWQEISWDEAIDFATAGLRRVRAAHGNDALATYFGNPNAHDLGAAFYGPPLQRALETRWRFSASSMDQWPKQFSSAHLCGSAWLLPVPDVDRTEFFLVLGANPLASNGSIMTAPGIGRRLRALRERGGKLVVVDPRRSETARMADEHLFIRPGTDAFLLFAMIHTLFAENLVHLDHLAAYTNGVEALRSLAQPFSPDAVAGATGIDAEAIRDLTRRFARAKRAICYGRIGTCTQEFGSLASWLVDCVAILTGNLDRPGGLLFPRAATSRGVEAVQRGSRLRFGRWRSRVRGLPEFLGELPVATLAEEMDTEGPGRVRGLVTMAGNPVLSAPNGDRLEAALANLEFMVSIDIYRNETTRHADVILPPESPLERPNHELAFEAFKIRHVSKASPAVFDRPEGVRPQWWILAELAGRMRGTDALGVDEALFSGLLSSIVGRPGSSCPDITPESARESLGKEPGPERLYDLLLRGGPYGDRFDPASDGLNLARLLASKHGIDLGPLEARLPAILATPSGAIELVPEALAEDVPRLVRRLGRSPSGMVLIGRRHVRSSNSWMHNIRALVKGTERCTLLVHPDDATRLGLRDGGRVRVCSRVGELEAPVVVTDELMPGVVSLPHGYGHGAPGSRMQVASEHAGVNSNRLTDQFAVEALSGNAILNGIPVEVSPVQGAPEPNR
jgi:anaerobic selenocysteine-containing dehydrogenase